MVTHPAINPAALFLPPTEPIDITWANEAAAQTSADRSTPDT